MKDGKPDYDFYERVRVDTQDENSLCFNGKVGAVLGRVQTDEKLWYYTIAIDDQSSTHCFFEHELVATGTFARREDFYDGTSVRIKVGKDGQGRVVTETGSQSE